MTWRKSEDLKLNLKEEVKQYVALGVELAVEDAMDLSQERLQIKGVCS